MGRLDWAFDHNNMNALLLYMANDWNITIINPKGSAPAQQTLDRMKFVTITHATFATATSLQHRREILNIAIEEGRTHARVESRETTDGTINGRHVVDVERSTDTFELRENVMLWNKSTDTIEKLTSSPPVTSSRTDNGVRSMNAHATAMPISPATRLIPF